MKTLLAQIRLADASQKCQFVGEVYERVSEVLARLQVSSISGNKALFGKFDEDLDEIEGVLTELETLLIGLDRAEIKRIKGNIEKDYGESVEILKFYGLLNPDGRSYRGDYGEFANRTFQLPSLEAILGRLTQQQVKLYRQMEGEGLAPKLQITPMAFNIRTLGQKIDAKRADLKMNTSDTYVWEEIKDEELIYAPKSIKASPDGKKIVIGDGLSKSQWIDAHGGFLIDIVPMKQHLEADPEIQKNAKGEVNYNAVQAEKYATRLKERGLAPMGYESYLVAQMQALRSKSPLDNNDTHTLLTCTLLLDSSLKMSNFIARGFWNGAGATNMNRIYTLGRSDSLRLRGSVRV